MLKKILTVAVMAAMVCVLLTVGVSAAEYLNQDFENGFDVFMANNNPPEGAARVEVLEGDNTVAFFDNQTASALQNRINSTATNLPKGGVMMFDFKTGQKVDNGYIYVEFHRGTIDDAKPKCVFQLTAVQHDDDTWYTYIITMNEDCTESMVYRKKRDTQEPFAFVANATTPTNGEATAMWRMYTVKHDCYFDNIRIFSGVFAKDVLFSMDGSEVNGIDDITAGTLTAELNIVCGDVTKETEDNGATYFAKGSKATPMVVFFDKNMRMVNCTQVVSDLNVGDNQVSIEVDTTEFADKLEGGFAGLYVLDDMMNIRPLSDAVELR